MRWVKGKSAGNLAEADERAGRGGTLTFDVEVGGQICMQDHRVPESTFFSNLLEFQRERMESGPQSFHEEQLLLLCQLDQRLQLCSVGSGRLLAQNMFTGVERIDSVLVVQSMRRSCADNLSGSSSRAGDVRDVPMYTASTSCHATPSAVHSVWQGWQMRRALSAYTSA